MPDTIFALSSGRPPAGIAVIRVSGPRAFKAAEALAGTLPDPRVATLRMFRDPVSGEHLDQGILLISDGPRTATGEDVAEFQCHGGQATIDAMLAALARLEGLRVAEPGEFTRQALSNGRIDLTEAEGLADLLAAETELQRKVALRRLEGSVRREMDALRTNLLGLAAAIELAIDYVDEDDGAEPFPRASIQSVAQQVDALLSRTSAERLRRGVRVIVAGPPNAGKSSLFNSLVGQDRAIVTHIEGTTRDSIEVPVNLRGVPVIMVDTAGLRDSDDPIERIGIERAQRELAGGDVTLWLGDTADAPSGSIVVHGKADLKRGRPGLPFSAMTGEGREELLEAVRKAASHLLPAPDSFALTARERDELSLISRRLSLALEATSVEVAAEHVRVARSALDRISGLAGVEEMLDALFSRFCVGK